MIYGDNMDEMSIPLTQSLYNLLTGNYCVDLSPSCRVTSDYGLGPVN